MPVKTEPHTLRAMQVQQTRERIMSAAAALFVERGYASTTLQAVAVAAGVAVETVYSRFGNKMNLLSAILEKGVVRWEDGRDVLDQPEIVEIESTADHRQQLRLLAAFSRGILERTYTAHRILRTAAAADASAAELQERDAQRRYKGQRAYIDMLLANVRLRVGLTSEDAADSYSALANPETYAFLVVARGWTADKFQQWLADALIRILL